MCSSIIPNSTLTGTLLTSAASSNRPTGLTARQKQLALQMFLAVAEAEARVHGSTVEKIHFHEVGAIDSIVDIVGVAVAFDLLGIDRVVCNAIPTGRGFVKIDHGICPIPAPGTAEILKGIPLADIPIESELTTPTGAAIAKTLADSFGPMPAMTIEAIGCGCGTKTFPERANVLRIFIGTATVAADTEHVVMLETNLDDVPGETIGHVRERLQSAGALDVFVTPVQMKKDRPGSCAERPLPSRTRRTLRRHCVRRNRHARHPPSADPAQRSAARHRGSRNAVGQGPWQTCLAHRPATDVLARVRRLRLSLTRHRRCHSATSIAPPNQHSHRQVRHARIVHHQRPVRLIITSA